MKRNAVLGVLALVFGIVSAWFGVTMVAANPGGEEPIVALRQQTMKTIAAAAKTIAGMFEGTQPYDRAKFAASAEAIYGAATALGEQFAPDTLGAPSAARVEIATNRADFDEIAEQLEKLAGALAASARNAPTSLTGDMRMQSGGTGLGGSLFASRQKENDPASMPVEHVFHLVLQTCSDCHAKFRLKGQ